jgi:hypothetical protein
MSCKQCVHEDLCKLRVGPCADELIQWALDAGYTHDEATAYANAVVHARESALILSFVAKS